MVATMLSGSVIGLFVIGVILSVLSNAVTC